MKLLSYQTQFTKIREIRSSQGFQLVKIPHIRKTLPEGNSFRTDFNLEPFQRFVEHVSKLSLFSPLIIGSRKTVCRTCFFIFR